MTVVKRSRKGSAEDLIIAIEKFSEALMSEGEELAIKDLDAAAALIKESAADSQEFKDGLAKIKAAFEEHELDAYSFKPKSSEGEWGPTEILYVTSTRVLSLLKRFGI